MSGILQKCVGTYPQRPALNPAEWPYTPAELESYVDYWMAMLRRLDPAEDVSVSTVVPISRLSPIVSRQLIHKGRKP